jgi:glycosyltransferase involved in cell wall biosynthesis
MSFLDRISVLILTHNEAPNIGRTLDALERLPEVVVLDSGSTDGTLDIVARYPNVRAVIHPFDSHSAQWTHGLTACGLKYRWVLALDADYVASAAIVDEIAELRPNNDVCGYRVAFRYCIDGRPLSGSLYQSHVVLYRRDRVSYKQEGHTQRLVVDGRIEDLQGRINHDDRKPLSRWLISQQKYAKLEADFLLATARTDLGWVDRIRLMGWPAPILVFFYTLIISRCILDGWPGWLYVLQRTVAEAMIALELAERRVRVATNHSPQG